MPRSADRSSEPWQFWIDVGGTFTDCLARAPSGQILRHKVLSSAVTKGIVGEGSGPTCVCDLRRRADPDRFWTGFRLRLLAADGTTEAESTLTECDSTRGVMRLATPVSNLRIGQSYELSSDCEAPVLAIRYLLGLGPSQPLPPLSLRLGTTRGTNALITRTGATTAFVTTRGFGDVLSIGYQDRPQLFKLDVHKPPPLAKHVVEVDERVDSRGQVLRPLDSVATRASLQSVHDQGVLSLAICLLNAYANPAHENRLAELAAEIGFDEISVSSQVAPLRKIVARGDTTVVDAYLSPVLRRYVEKVRQSLGRACVDFRVMTSAGGLVQAETFRGKDSILSGPAGGVVGVARVAAAAGAERVIGFDMGGTSTDVCRYEGRFDLDFETQKAGVRIVAPMMAIETVAAGGGSICDFDGVKLIVGPQSAGADPGPACYGKGGPLTVTDVNFFLGKIRPLAFPFPLDRQAVVARLEQLTRRIATHASRDYSPHELAHGFLQVANTNMVEAIRTVSVAKGCNPAEYTLVAFGGAAAQHSCAIAQQLRIGRILNHPDAGIMSALGIGLADARRFRVAGVYRDWNKVSGAELDRLFAQLTEEARVEMAAEDVDRGDTHAVRTLDLRFRGLDQPLTIREPPHGDYAHAYREQFAQFYGYLPTGKEVEIVAARVELIARSPTTLPLSQSCAARQPHALETATVYFDGAAQLTQVYRRADLRPGDRLRGPAIVEEDHATTIVDPHWDAEVLSGGELLLTVTSDDADARDENATTGRSRKASARPERTERQRASSQESSEADPVLLEIFNQRFAAIAEQMGRTLQRTAISVNVKERLDFSCAIFTARGELVVNAPHIPVHLGAMGETVRHVLTRGRLAPGDVVVTNDPFGGGSHLPDLTVVTPVHDRDGSLLFLTASRAHHAEIGGITPGSMPAFSTNLAQEGVLLRDFKVFEAGRSQLDKLEQLLAEAPYPSRQVSDNIADVAAQIAANRQGAADLFRFVDEHSWPVVSAYMRHIQAAAAYKMRLALGRLADGERRFVDYLDDGTPICLQLTVAGQTARFDFNGTGPVLPNNLNANRAIVTAAVMYCLRCLIDEDIPLNQGVLEPVEIELPECLLNPPAAEDPALCPAVAGGNVETSQRVVDVILGALGIAAASQGTMNNLLFGDDSFGYYETICGGAGATPSGPGADAVQTHMTNTRLTDPEVLESRFPVRLRRFAIRRGSGGAGLHRGGDGVIREIEFLRPLQVSIVSQRRGPYLPYGLGGGDPGLPGENVLQHTDDSVEWLANQVQFSVDAGDRLTIKTPGGGGAS